MKGFIFVFLGFCCFGTIHAQETRQVQALPCMEPFYHGVASGDPLSDAVIIWTRVTPPDNTGAPILVKWKMGADTSMTNIVQQGSVLANPSSDYTVKVDVQGLDPDTYYYYEFMADSAKSIQGRTKTAPVNMKDSLRFAVVSCANLEAGFFNAYGIINNKNDVDAVIGLGDYIYEYETGGYSPNPNANRFFEPTHEIISLEDYRGRYSIYHLDEDLRKMHQYYPFIGIWDDHESANDSWTGGAENHDGSEGSWSQRKNYAKQAFFEWLPIRETSQTNPYQIYRKLSYGNLVDLFMLDTRLEGREEQSGTTGSTVNDPNRTLLGQNQFNWLEQAVSQSTATYKVIGQQVMMAPLEVFGTAVNGDQWDGYPAERENFFNFINTNNIDNVVVLTGDIHTSWANDLPGSGYDSGTGNGSVGVEFVTPSVTSPGADFGGGIGASAIQTFNSHMKFVDLSEHGFYILDINQQRAQADWFYVNTIDNQSLQYFWGASFFNLAGERHLHETTVVSAPRPELLAAIQPQECPRPIIEEEPNTNSLESKENITMLSVYPNPVKDEVHLQYSYSGEGSDQVIQVFDMKGNLILSQENGHKGKGTWLQSINVNELASGQYILQFKIGSDQASFSFVKQ